MDNSFDIKKIEYKATAHCYCPLGNDWYTNNIIITIYPAYTLVDYCDIDKFIKNEIEGKKYIIEEAVAAIKKEIQNMASCDVEVRSTVADAVHGEVTVFA